MKLLRFEHLFFIEHGLIIAYYGWVGGLGWSGMGFIPWKSLGCKIAVKILDNHIRIGPTFEILFWTIELTDWSLLFLNFGGKPLTSTTLFGDKTSYIDF